MAINTPRDVPNLIRWYRADDYDPDGTGHWPDHSLNGWNRIDVAAGSPTHNATGGPNSNDAIELDGSTDRFAVGAGIAYADEITIISVSKVDTAASNDMVVSLDDGVNPRIAQHRYNDDSTYEFVVNGGAATASGTGTMTDWNILTGIRRTSDCQAYVNGVSSGAVSSGGSNPTGARTTRIGSYGTGSLRFDGSLAELLFFNKALTDAEHDDVLKYLADAHAMSVTLSDASAYNGSGTRPEPADDEAHHLWWDGAWTLNSPRALRHVDTEDKTYVAFGGGSMGGTTGRAKIMSIDHGTGTVEEFDLKTGLGEDLHLSPVIHVRADGKLLVVYTGHNSDMWQRISTNAEDVSAWGSETTIDSGSCTYPSIVELSDRIVLHYRQGGGAGGLRVYRESTDDGDTWGAETTLVSNGTERPYMTVAEHPTSADRIDYLVTDGHPDEVATNSVYHFYRDDVGSGIQFFKSDGTLIGGVADLPFSPSDATKIYDGTTSPGWDWDLKHDASGNPVALFAEIISSSSHVMHYAKWNGSSWDDNDIVNVGGGVNNGGSASSGAHIDGGNINRVWVSIANGTGSQSDLHEYITADGGANWTSTQVTDSPHGENSTPVVPVNRHEDVGVVWSHGNQTNFDDFNLGIWYMGGVEAVAEDPEPGQPTVTITSFNTTGVTAETSVFVASTAGGSHVQTDWRLTKVSDATVVTISSTSDLTSIINAGSTVPLDTDANVYTLEARHGEST